MQSTGHSSMHPLSSTSTQDSVMIYVTSQTPLPSPQIAGYQPSSTLSGGEGDCERAHPPALLAAAHREPSNRTLVIWYYCPITPTQAPTSHPVLALRPLTLMTVSVTKRRHSVL